MKFLVFILLFSFSIFSDETKEKKEEKSQVEITMEKLEEEFKKNEFSEEEKTLFYKRLEEMNEEEFVKYYPFTQPLKLKPKKAETKD